MLAASSPVYRAFLVRVAAFSVLRQAPLTYSIAAAPYSPFSTVPRRPRGGGGRPPVGGSSSSGASAPSRPPINFEIHAPQVRVVDEAGASLGIMTVAAAVERAKATGVDVVLVAAQASPPVARLTPVHRVMAALREAAAERRRAARVAEAKEVRLSACIFEHDRDTKAARVVSFLREGRPVRVVVSLTPAAWTQEEAARRQVLASVVRAVATAGVGGADLASIREAGASLVALFSPRTTPQPATEIEHVLRALSVPNGWQPAVSRAAQASDGRAAATASAVPASVPATAAAEASGGSVMLATAAPQPVQLPAASLLRQLITRKAVSSQRSAAAAAAAAGDEGGSKRDVSELAAEAKVGLEDGEPLGLPVGGVRSKGRLQHKKALPSRPAHPRKRS